MVAPPASHDHAGSGVNVHNLAATVRADNLQSIDPFAPKADKVDGNDIAGRLGAHDIQYPGKALDLAMLVEVPCPVVIAVVILAGSRCERLDGGEPNKASHDKSFENGCHRPGISHTKAVNPLSASHRPAGSKDSTSKLGSNIADAVIADNPAITGQSRPVRDQ
ncbi:hypothetical protein [Mesorhizobium sp. B2-3-5]|uniref:hypothetical protein n=1 Tax=Mesorhizobium sp. B2-3-5 TaxID=2589958 RepID=UPI0015E2B8FD|nr:hypothetical protein [Mesorhizobium sp. B2-3-5]